MDLRRLRSGGRSAMAAAGAAGLVRIGMRRARSMEAELLDRAKPAERDPSLQLWTMLSKRYDPTPGTWLEDHAGLDYHPPNGTVVAKRHRPYADAERAGVAIPDIVANRYEGQQQGALFDVIAVGRDVTSIARGDRVVAVCFIGKDTRILGPDLFTLRAPEWRCRATVEDLSSDTIWGGSWVADPDHPWLLRFARAAVNDDAIVRRIPHPSKHDPDAVTIPAFPPAGAHPADVEYARDHWKLLVRRKAHRHGEVAYRRDRVEMVARADGCGCGGDVLAVLVP